MNLKGIEFEYDELKMYMGYDYTPNEFITVHQPTIGEIVEFGEVKFYQMLYDISNIPENCKYILHMQGIDYSTVSDFELFIRNIRAYSQEETSLLFGDLDFSKSEVGFIKTEDEENPQKLVMQLEKQHISGYPQIFYIDELLYQNIIGYVRKMFGIHHKREKAFDNYTKRILIEEDKQKFEQNKNKKDKQKSVLKPLISGAVNSPGFKYKKTELNEVNIYEFMDSIKRISVIMTSAAILNGMYGGFIDGSKIKPEAIDISRVLD